jgi:hypothetical protein
MRNAIHALLDHWRTTAPRTHPHRRTNVLILHCTDHADADRAWRMLATVPQSEFVPTSVYVAGEPLYMIVRTEAGDQTTVPIAARPVRTDPAP